MTHPKTYKTTVKNNILHFLLRFLFLIIIWFTQGDVFAFTPNKRIVKESKIPTPKGIDSSSFYLKKADSLKFLADKYSKLNLNDSTLFYYQKAIKVTSKN